MFGGGDLHRFGGEARPATKGMTLDKKPYPMILPISAVIPTADRPEAIARCIKTLVGQSPSVTEIIVVDASEEETTKKFCEGLKDPTKPCSGYSFGDSGCSSLVYVRAGVRGAASQRNEGVAAASQPFILFLDDDVELQRDCLAKLWESMMSDGSIGGVGSIVVNQKYVRPGVVTRFLYCVLAGRRLDSFAGKCLGPVVTVLPEDREDLPEVVPVEWLNAGCTLYRRAALPSPVFPDHFTGYSLGEDANLSLTVAKRWRLVNARAARVFHHNLPGAHKSDAAELARMSLVNRHYIMTETLGRRSLADYGRLVIVEIFGIVSLLRTREGFRQLPAVVKGKLKGIWLLAMRRRQEATS